MEQFKKKFLEEAIDLIYELEKTMLEIEQSPDNKELIEKIFRAMHSLKGGSSMFGFKEMDRFTHHLESMYDLIRNKKLVFSPEILEITYAAIDHLKKLIFSNDEGDEILNKNNEELLKKIAAFSESPEIIPSIASAGDLKTKEIINKNQKENTFYILFQPDESLLEFGNNPLYIIEELSHLGVCEVFSHINKIPDLDLMEPAKCYIYWEVFISTDIDRNALHDVFIFVEDCCHLEIENISDFNVVENREFVKFLHEIHDQSDKFNIEQIKQKAKNFKKTEQFSISLNNKNINSKKNNSQLSSIRVSSEKLDMLMNFVSELVTTQARLSLLAEQSNSADLVSVAENIEKISRNLRDNAFSICLIPLESVMIRFQRLVRDLSAELNKDVVFVTEGAETELDKSIIENITDPIMHILRNSLDHGIESTEERKKLGKPKQGKILLKAFCSGTHVVIKIQDDGAGISIDEIKRLAIQKNLIASENTLSDKEILDLLFLPGFTTSEKITNVSGRGVGLDVVKRKITDILGEVSIETQVNIGTTFTITLPLTLSIIDGLLVAIDDAKYIIPLSNVVKCFEFKHEQLKYAVNNLVFVGDGHIPLVYLRDEFDCISDPPEIEQVVVVTHNDERLCLSVDHIVGEYQAVIKPLGKLYKKQDIVSGATILSDGTVALVLDPNKIIIQATSK